MDTQSVALAVRLQLEEIESLKEGQKGKHPEGEVPDHEYALELYEQELVNQNLLLSDRRIAYSISQAVHSDADVIGAIQVEENDSRRDHQLACTLGGVAQPTTNQTKEDFAYIDVDDKLVQHLSRLNKCEELLTGGMSRVENPTASSSRSGIDLPIRSGPRKVTCTACQDDKPFFDVITSDESLFPPRCCRQNIPVALANDFLSQDLLLKFRAKSIEFSTPNRTYCYRDSCSAFIPPSRIHGDIGTCPSCLHETCTLCKQDSHTGDCPADTALQSLLDLATAEGWRRCNGCRRVVELNTGCNHITSVPHLSF
jgi:hypothetical protein